MKSLLLFFLFLTSCSLFDTKTYKPSERQLEINRIRDQVAAEAEKELGLKFRLSGGKVQKLIMSLSLVFDYYKPVSIDEGREILLKTSAKFLSLINANERLRKELCVYPFIPKKIEVRIFIHNPDGSEVSSKEISSVSTRNGVVKYKTGKPETKEFKTIFSELFDGSKI